MDKEKLKADNKSLKIELSLTSLMFFAPFVKYLLKKSSFDINKEELNFVESYISLWWINIILLGLTLISWFLASFYETTTLITIYQIIISLLIIVLFIWCVWAITETQIIKTSLSKKKENIEYNNDNKLETLLSYLPGYSIYLWYNKHDFDKPDLFLKESLLLRILFGTSCLLPTPIIAIFIMIVILIRIVTLIWNINIIPLSISEFLSSLFYKNPEEIWSYIWWSIVFIFHWNYNISYWKYLIGNYKKEYQYLYNFKKSGKIQWQYWLWLVFIIIVLLQVDLGNISWLIIITIALLLIRYGIMLFKWWRSPALPIMREFIELIDIIKKPFTSKKKQWNV